MRIGDTWVDLEAAAVGDGVAAYSAIYQLVALDPGTYRIDVDVRGVPSAVVPAGWLPDVFFASVYVIDDPGQFDLLGGGWDGAAPLFDLSSAGFTGVQGELIPSAKGGDWLQFTGTFDLSLAYAVPVFELVADNGIAADSTVWIDNVRIALIPEPRVWLLLMVGAGVLGARRRRGDVAEARGSRP